MPLIRDDPPKALKTRLSKASCARLTVQRVILLRLTVLGHRRVRSKVSGAQTFTVEILAAVYDDLLGSIVVFVDYERRLEALQRLHDALRR